MFGGGRLGKRQCRANLEAAQNDFFKDLWAQITMFVGTYFLVFIIMERAFKRRGASNWGSLGKCLILNMIYLFILLFYSIFILHLRENDGGV